MMTDDRTLGQRIADMVAHFGGSWKFIFLFSGLMVIWMVINSLAFLEFLHFDKPPFILLNLILSTLAALQAPIIMMSQNRAEAKQDRAYRALFQEIKEMIEKDIDIEDKIMEMIKIDHEDEVKYRVELAGLTKAIKEMVEIDHSDEVQYKKEINQLTREMSELKEMVRIIHMINQPPSSAA